MRNWHFYRRRQHNQSRFGRKLHFGDLMMNSISNQSISTNQQVPPKPTSRQSLILSVNKNNEFVILPHGSNSTTDHRQQQEQSRTAILSSLSEEDAEATRREMAVSVNALDQSTGPDLDQADQTLLSRYVIDGEAPPIYEDSLK